MAAIWNSPWDTNNEWYNKMMASGQYWNDFDLANASQDQWFADEVFAAKNDYANATTDEARALANARAEAARQKYNYSSGTAGAEYNPTSNPEPASAAPAAKTSLPTPTAGTSSVWGDEMTGNYGTVKDTPSFSYSAFDEPEPFQYEDYKEPEPFKYDEFQAPDPFQYDEFVAPEPFEYEKYVDDTPDWQHSDAYNKAMDDVLNYGDFAYDYTTDPLYSVYKKEYTREGQRAQADALAQAAALTGGIPSSYATMAGQQANNYYASKIADKIPELRNQAYNEWQNNYNMLRDKYNTAAQGDQFDYGVYSDKKNNKYQQYLDDLNMRYGIYRDNYNDAYKRWGDKVNMDYGIYRDNYNDAYTRWGDKVNMDYGIYRDQNNDAWNHYINNRDFDYGKYRDNYNDAYNLWRDKTNLDFDIYNTDYSHLMDIYGMSEDNYAKARSEELDAEAKEDAKKLDLAKLLASMGDYSALDEYYGSGTKLSDAYKASLVPTGGYRGGTVKNKSGGIDHLSDRGQALLQAAKGNPEVARQFIDQNWDNMDYILRSSMLQELGYSAEEAMALSKVDQDVGYGGGMTGNEIGALLGQSTVKEKPTLTAAQVNSAIKNGTLTDAVLSAYEYYYGEPYQAELPPPAPTLAETIAENVTNYSSALKFLSDNGLEDAQPLTRYQWNKNEDSRFATYDDYLKAFVFEHMGGG